jgi:hypothetical protein
MWSRLIRLHCILTTWNHQAEMSSLSSVMLQLVRNAFNVKQKGMDTQCSGFVQLKIRPTVHTACRQQHCVKDADATAYASTCKAHFRWECLRRIQ